MSTIRTTLAAIGNDPHEYVLWGVLGCLLGVGVALSALAEVVSWFCQLFHQSCQQGEEWGEPPAYPEALPLLGVATPGPQTPPPGAPEWRRNPRGKTTDRKAGNGGLPRPDTNQGHLQDMPPQTECPPHRERAGVVIVHAPTDMVSVEYGTYTVPYPVEEPSPMLHLFQPDDMVIDPADFPTPSTQPHPDELDRWADDGGAVPDTHDEQAEVVVSCAANDHKGDSPAPPLRAFYLHKSPPTVPECPLCEAGHPAVTEDMLRPLTPAEAEATLDAAEPVPLSKDQVQRMVDYATRRTDALANLDRELSDKDGLDDLDTKQLRRLCTGRKGAPRNNNKAGMVAFLRGLGITALDLQGK